MAILYRCPISNEWRNTDIRGTFLVDNNDRLCIRVPRGHNKKFIINYLFAFPCSKLSDIRKALLRWRGIKVCDESRGQYTSYFYDRYMYKWYGSKYWQKMVGTDKKSRALLTIDGLTEVDLRLANRIKNWEVSAEERTRMLLYDVSVIKSNMGKKYATLFPEKL